MVLTRSMAARRKLLALPDDILVVIAGDVAATSPQPMKDVLSLGATCQAMRKVCKERAVRIRVALDREEYMRWFHNDRYLEVVDNLAAAGNPEACFVLGITLVFAVHDNDVGIEWLRRAAVGNHNVAAYVLGVLLYREGNIQEAERYIRQVEDAVGHGCKQASGWTNRACLSSRALAIQAVRDVTWRMGGMMGLVPIPQAEDEQCCKRNGCGMPEGWASDCAVFCSEACRITHELSEFFSRLP